MIMYTEKLRRHAAVVLLLWLFGFGFALPAVA